MIDKIISKIFKLNIPENHIITYSVCINAFGLLSLIYGEFLLFIMLFIFSIYLNKIYKEYIKKYEIKNRHTEIYYNLADYIKVISTYGFISIIYKKKINYSIIFLSIILLIICNINFTIEHILLEENKENKENKENEENYNYNKLFMKYWGKTISWIPLDKLKIIHKFTKYFNEILIISYFVIIIIYIHYK